MSEETNQPAAAPENLSMGSLFLGIVADDAAPAPETTPEPTAETPETLPVALEPVSPPPASPAVDDVPIWEGQREAGAAFKVLKDELAAEKARAAYLAGLAEGRTPQQQAAEQPAAKADEDPQPDPEKFTDDTAYYDAVRAWDRRQAVKEVRAELLPEVQALKEHAAEQAWASSMSRAEAQAGADWTHAAAYANHMQQVSPGFAADLLNAKDPGRFVLETFKLARGQAQAPAATPAAPIPTPAPAIAAGATIETILADPAQREAALRILAAQNAAKGLVPNVPPGPLGVGSGPSAIGAQDGITVASIRATNNPQKLEETRAAVFGAWIGEGFDN